MVQLVIFEADPIDSVANDSINDNNIENCNKGIGVKDKIKCLEALSSRIKELEVLAKGDEMMVLRKLEEMEQRDRERRKKHGPVDPYCTFLANHPYKSGHRFSLCKTGDRAWNRGIHNFDSRCSDAIFYKDDFYTMDSKGLIWVIRQKAV
ncbi:hypothetical protein SLEP1_g48157 [Rubroshorea leprosula]|uniref:Uncharacterized protein n=1 Tax=Rubroshorea leprosula TaxID=152421 RepID=A0AAV5LUN1_9ROSI|nr:hypothetical protein SLEP1_g48157 [Rubroshorea leprosula]